MFFQSYGDYDKIVPGEIEEVHHDPIVGQFYKIRHRDQNIQFRTVLRTRGELKTQEEYEQQIKK